MTNRPPPVPPASRSDKGPGAGSEAPVDTSGDKRAVPENTSEQARHGNIKQNTTNQGYQQDR